MTKFRARTVACLTATAIIGSLLLPAQLAAEKPKVASTANEADRRSRELVSQLGDEQFTEREQASRLLVEIGYPAISELAVGSNSPDREIRTRSRRILKLIREVDFQRRLASFMADRDGISSHGLPGWDAFRKLCGEDQVVRELFIEMQKAEPDLMRTIDLNPEAGRGPVAARVGQLQQAFDLYGEDCSIGSAAAIIFTALQHNLAENQQAGSVVFRLCQHESVRNAATAGVKRPPLRRLLGGWVSQANSWLITQALMLSNAYDLPEGLPLAERSLESKDTTPFERQYAIPIVGKFGAPRHLPLLESLLNDASQPFDLQSRKGTTQLQVRDIALFAILQLSKQDPATFGFRKGAADGPVSSTTQNWYLESDEKRAAAIDRWRALSVGQRPPSNDQTR